ncbi:unnamed protein product, partial [Staurois parvus]
MCPLSGLLTLLVCSIFCHWVLGQCTGSHLLLPGRNFHGALNRLSCCCQVRVSHGSCTAPICAVSIAHTLPCATFQVFLTL